MLFLLIFWVIKFLLLHLSFKGNLEFSKIYIVSIYMNRRKREMYFFYIEYKKFWPHKI